MLAEKAAMLDKVKELSYISSLCFIFKDYLLVREREREGGGFLQSCQKSKPELGFE